MKMLLTAVALTIASPALAQAADPHAGHKMGEMNKMGEMKMSPDAMKAHCDKMGAKGHKMDGHMMGGMKMSPDAMKAQCDKMKADGRKKGGQGLPDGKAKADPHAGHDMSSK